MTEQEFHASLAEILEMEPGSIKGDETLNDLPGWDSMSVLAIIAIADQKLGRLIQAATLARCRTVAELRSAVLGSNSAASGKT